MTNLDLFTIKEELWKVKKRAEAELLIVQKGIQVLPPGTAVEELKNKLHQVLAEYDPGNCYGPVVSEWTGRWETGRCWPKELRDLWTLIQEVLREDEQQVNDLLQRHDDAELMALERSLQQRCRLAEWLDPFTGVGPALLTLLRRARSVRHLQQLHKLMPANCRLRRRDFMQLEKTWQEMYPEGRPADKRRTAAEYREELAAACGSAHLGEYYAEQIGHGHSRLWAIGSRRTDRIYAAMPGGEQELYQPQFAAELYGTLWQVRCSLSPACTGEVNEERVRREWGFHAGSFWESMCGQRLGVSLELYAEALTEPLTHALLKLRRHEEQDIEVIEVSAVGSTVRGALVSVKLVLPAEEFVWGHLNLHDVQAWWWASGRARLAVAKPSFCDLLTARLKERGLPIGLVRPFQVRKVEAA